MAYRITTLDIPGFAGEKVPNTLFRRDVGADEIGILLPGIGYTAQMPLLWYARTLLQDRGADVLTVDYAYTARPEFQRFGPEAEERLRADASAALQAALQHRPYARLTLVGKSLGTLALGHLLADQLVEPRRAVWLTPLLKRDVVREQMLHQASRSLAVIGTADPRYDPDLLRELRATGCQVLVVDGADHALEIEGNTVQSVQAMERIAETIQRFLAG